MEVSKLLSVEVLKIMLMEDSSPLLTDQQLEMLAGTYDNINEACYYGCLMKATSANSSLENITIGPISIESTSSDFWLKMADGFYRKFLRDQNDIGLTGMTMRRSDEL
jgi:hypothetical protein|nr:MAG TPA: hypothetical protein [Caudoviricetes sp.]